MEPKIQTNVRVLKFRCSEKATKFEKNFLKVWTLLSSSKPLGRLRQIFVAFSEKLNFDLVNFIIDSNRK